ncbi:L-lactate dehydrogenase (cytochrome) [Saccharopolyspora antimicrobica]|uniref:L-lactate dehydrogenase (Cytochrome) n=1 Tax=Saccharopolyspora antimicrobica TaxID=455193 RepID=A0A1I4SQC1_9PSEU|nr:alpha-hydroxy acid oxidase [Saccharopolyspora antimicrobica]RKT86049.1 L-lactate dehydrogenase (cytochrome) [Saccharopolyspora antimicrobica]SFM66581.1 L-lactate dehydrogenase (cytochrome) [Saccharopolyspora antimicrobica]
MVKRQLPRWSELRPLLRVKPPQFNPTERRLSAAHSIADLRTIARLRTPRAVFDYTDGAAEGEISLRRARRAFRDVEFRPSVLRDVSAVDTSTEILGKPSKLPFSFAPTGFTRMMNHEGEPAVARVAERTGIPYALSTMGTTSVEDLAAAAPEARKWFQLYLWKDREASRALVERAQDAGYEALILTVDTPVGGARLRDARNGLTIPPELTLKTIVDGAMHPAWWFNLLTTEPLTFASFHHWSGTVHDLINSMFDPSLNYADLEWLRELWQGPLIIKGIQNPDDARRVVELGADGVILSNHGGRQLDRAPTMLELLPAVREAIGDRAEILLDTGITSGADIVAAIALGADSCLIGRAYLYGLMAGGERGVQKAVDILSTEIVRTLQLLGVRSIADLDHTHAALRR